jgi:hypothetical protein
METDGGPRSRTPTLHASLLSGGRARTTARASRASEPSPMGRSIFSEERSGTHRASKSLPFVPPATRVTSASDSIRRALSGGEPAVRKLKKPPLWPRSVLHSCHCICMQRVSTPVLLLSMPCHCFESDSGFPDASCHLPHGHKSPERNKFGEYTYNLKRSISA